MSPRIVIPLLDKTPAASRPILEAIEGRLGFLPNVFRLMALSPQVLAGFATLQGNLNSTLDLATRNAIALAVSEVNACNYCLSVHSYTASHFAKSSAEEIALNRKGESANARTAVAARFAAHVVDSRGHIPDAEFDAIRNAGFSDAQILEVIAWAVQAVMTNLFNNVSGTEIDSPTIVQPQ